MKLKRNLAGTAVAIMAVVACPSWAHGTLITTPVTGWVVHNGTATVTDGGTAAPTFTPGDNITVMAPFADIELTQDGDYVTFMTTLTMTGRTTTGVNTLNTQLRVGLFDGPPGAVVANDVPNLGFIIEYTNLASGGLIREQNNPAQTAPFVGPVNIGNGTPDSDSIAGANPPPVDFMLTLTRNAGKLDLTGSISGGSHLANYTVTGYSSATFPMDGPFNFNRVGLFLGDGVNGATASLANSKIVTNVPEPASAILATITVLGGMMTGQRARRARCGQTPMRR
jgi:hypothetical protein